MSCLVELKYSKACNILLKHVSIGNRKRMRRRTNQNQTRRFSQRRWGILYFDTWIFLQLLFTIVMRSLLLAAPRELWLKLISLLLTRHAQKLVNRSTICFLPLTDFNQVNRAFYHHSEINF